MQTSRDDLCDDIKKKKYICDDVMQTSGDVFYVMMGCKRRETLDVMMMRT
jgi:hypothetical protein